MRWYQTVTGLSVAAASLQRGAPSSLRGQSVPVWPVVREHQLSPSYDIGNVQLLTVPSLLTSKCVLALILSYSGDKIKDWQSLASGGKGLYTIYIQSSLLLCLPTVSNV